MKHFTDVLREIRSGAVVDAASEALATVTKGVLETHKAGSVTVTLTIKPPKKHGDNAVTVLSDVKIKEPRDDLPEAIFYASEDGDLLRDDPTRQMLWADAEDAPHRTRQRERAEAAE